MKTAVVFDNLGPYHRARLRAGAAHCEMLAVEVAERSGDYAWTSEAIMDLQTTTLLGGGTSGTASPRQIAHRMDKTLQDFKPEVVFVPGWSSPAAFLALRWCMRYVVPAVIMSESTVWDEPRRAWREWVKRRIVQLFSAALVGGQPQAEYIQGFGMPANRIFLGYDVVDNEYFARETEKAKSKMEKLRKRYGLPERYFLASSRFIEKKNLTRLFAAYASYRQLSAKNDGRCVKSRRPWDLVLLGDGELRSSLTSLRATLDLCAFVHMPGFVQYSELPAYYGLASGFIHASTTEPWGLVVNEAMASGLPVLVSNRCGCARDLVEDGRNGFCFDPYNTMGLAKLMLEMSSMSDERRTELGTNGRQIIARWGTEAFASGMQSAAEEAMRTSGPPGRFLDRLAFRVFLQ